MANTIPNQPIIFDYEDDCLLASSELKIMAEHGDLTQFQLGLEPCGTDASLILNPEFNGSTNWVVGSYWSVGGGQAVKQVGLSSAIAQSFTVPDGQWVRLRFTVSSIENGSLDFLYGGSSSQIITVSEKGSYEFWIESENVTGLAFSASGATSLTLTDLELISINTNYIVNILDLNGVVVDTIDTTDGYFNFADGFFTATIDWDALNIQDGCYTIQVVPPCRCSQGGITALDFETSTQIWEISQGWTIASGTATFNSSVDGEAELLHTVCNDVEYEVAYTVTGVSATERFQVSLGGANGIQRTSDGTYTETITSNGTKFSMLGIVTLGTANFTVTDFSLKAVTPVETLDSNEILVSEQPFACGTLALAMCNDSDALGFGFENTGFRPLMRIPASLNRSSYGMERLSYDNSIGRKSPYYGRSRVKRELGIDGKYFMHDFAHLFGMADHFYINDVEYFVEEDEYPSISWGEFDDVGGVTIIVSKKEQLIENRRISSASVGCLPDGNELLDNLGETITDQDSTIITTG